jgi:type II secretory pathway predicted ATPase ExeA
VFNAPRQFGLFEAPFASLPDARFLFNSRAYAETLNYIAAGIEQREAVIVVTGKAGTGKTLLCGQLQDRIGCGFRVSVVTDLELSGDGLVRKMLRDFDVPAHISGPGDLDEANGEQLVTILQRTLASLAASDVGPVVVIDAAERSQPALLEQLGLLAGVEAGTSPLLQIVLLGRPSLNQLLIAPEVGQFGELVSCRCRLEPLAPREVQPYIERRLWIAHGGPAAAAGTDGSKVFWRVGFTSAAVRLTARLSAGIPLAINRLSDRALEACFERRGTRVDASDVVSAARQLTLPVPFRMLLESRTRLASVALLVLAAAVTASLILHSPSRLADAVSPSTIAATNIAFAVDSGPAASGAAVSAQTLVSPLVESESFTVVAASFRSPSRAAAFAARLTDIGLPAFAQATTDEWHQVIVGPYASRDEAQAAQRQLATAQLTNTKIVATAPKVDGRREG